MPDNIITCNIELLIVEMAELVVIEIERDNMDTFF